MKTTQPAPATQRETPESEAAQREFESGHGYPLAVHVEFAKRLERELAEAKREAANSHKVVVETSQTVSEYFKENATLRQSLAQMEKERDEARAERSHFSLLLAEAQNELAELRTDRERLDWLAAANRPMSEIEEVMPLQGEHFRDKIDRYLDAARNQQEKA